MSLRTARVQGKPGRHGKTLPAKQNKGPKERQGGRQPCHAVALEVEDAGSEVF